MPKKGHWPLLKNVRRAGRIAKGVAMKLHRTLMFALCARPELMHRVFSPTAQDTEQAWALLAAFRAAEPQGIRAVRHLGMMVDYANVRLAERTLALA